MTRYIEPDETYVQAKRVKRMAAFDGMAKEHRELINEYGMNIVTAFIDCGVPKPRHIRHLISVVLAELRTPLDGHPWSNQGVKTNKQGRET